MYIFQSASMDLYRGMSNLEFYCWHDRQILPKGKNFTSEPLEAIKLGKRYVLRGELIIFSMNYDPEGFNTILKESIVAPGWYQNNEEIYLGLGNFEIYSPREAVNNYQELMDKKVISLFKKNSPFMNYY